MWNGKGRETSEELGRERRSGRGRERTSGDTNERETEEEGEKERRTVDTNTNDPVRHTPRASIDSRHESELVAGTIDGVARVCACELRAAAEDGGWGVGWLVGS